MKKYTSFIVAIIIVIFGIIVIKPYIDNSQYKEITISKENLEKNKKMFKSNYQYKIIKFYDENNKSIFKWWR